MISSGMGRIFSGTHRFPRGIPTPGVLLANFISLFHDMKR